MAIHHLTTDDVFAAWENAVVGVGVEANEFVFIYKTDVERQVLIDEIDLLQGEFTSGDIEFLASSGRIAVFGEKLLQVGCKPSGFGCGRCRSVGGFSSNGCAFDTLLRRGEEGVSNFQITLFHIFKFLGRDHGIRSGIEDGFFLLHQIATVENEFFARLDELFFVACFEEIIGIADVVAHHVVKSPHRGGGTVEAFLFQKGIELVLLARIVDGVFAKLVKKLQPLILDDGILHQVFHGKEETLHLLILLIIARERMIFGHIGTRIVHVSFKELDFLRHVFAYALFVCVFDERLFDESEVERTDFPHTLCHFFTSFFESYFSCDIACLNI